MSKQKADYFAQCTLEQRNADGTKTVTVTYIPKEYAVKDKKIAMKDNDVWSEWIVATVGHIVEGDYVREHRDDYRTQRDASDI